MPANGIIAANFCSVAAPSRRSSWVPHLLKQLASFIMRYKKVTRVWIVFLTFDQIRLRYEP